MVLKTIYENDFYIIIDIKKIMSYTQKWIVGAHTGFNGQICDTIKESVYYGMYATQFFLGNPKAFNRSKISETDIEKSNKLLSRFPMHVFTHFPYIANLSGSKNSLAWDGDTEQDFKTEKVLQGVQHELDILNQLNCESSGIVIHPGNHVDRKKGLTAISQSIDKLRFNGPTKLLLENSAGQGTSLATTFTEISEIIQGVNNPKNIGVCVDTCHLYAYGDYDLSKVAEVKRMFTDFDESIGLEKFSLLHLNDSKCPIKSCKDRHACLGTGYIWGDSWDSLIYLLDRCNKHNIPVILETHGMDMITLAYLPKN